MIIGFDAKRLFFNQTGLGVYSRTLLKTLFQQFPQNTYRLFAANPERSPYFSEFSDFEIISSGLPFWRSALITSDLIKQHCVIYHGLSHELPLGMKRTGARSVVTVHDVIFRVEPSLYPTFDRLIYHLKWKHSCRIADRIIAVSEHTKKDLCQYYEVDPERVVVIPPPVALPAVDLSSEEVRLKYRLPPDFLLSVGSLTPRKNVILIVKAMALVPDSLRMPLVVVGRGKEENRIRRLAAELDLIEDLHFLGHVPAPELAALYHMAYALIYPSFYEGFGIPVVESLLSGTPVITSDRSALPEAAGEGAILIDPESEHSLSKAMLDIQDGAIHTELSLKGRAHAQRYLPEVVAARHIGLYRSIL